MPPASSHRFLLTSACIAVVGAGVVWWQARPEPSPVPATASPDSPPLVEIGPNERLDVTHDRALVFRKALWRRPAADDVILGAERREIAGVNDGGVKTWQWFLAVQPGPELRAWLETNPFALSAASARSSGNHKISPPEWFPRELDGFTVQQNAEGRLVFWYSAEQNLLYASDSGFGFSDVQRPL